MKRTLIAAVLFGSLALSGCTDNNNAYKVLVNAGYTNVTMTGYTFFACSDDDTFHSGFTATGPTGKAVKGTVCSGWFKGSTIRY